MLSPVAHAWRFARDDLSNDASTVATARGKFIDERLGVIATGDDDQTNSHIEGPQHVLIRDAAALLQPPEDRRHFPRGPVYDRRGAVRKDPWQVVGDTTAGDMRHPFDPAGTEQRLNHAQIRSMGDEQRLANGSREFRNVTADVELQPLEHDPPRERVTVGV